MGNAVPVTGLTLAVGVSTWVFPALWSPADRGLSLSFVFLGSMIGALLVLAAVAFFLFPRAGGASR